jgi:hypothetical protein
MKKILMLLCILSLFSNSNAQTANPRVVNADTISYSMSFWTGERFTYQGKSNLRFKEIKEVLKFDSANTALVSKLETARIINFVVSFAGGFCLGFGLSSKPVNVTLTSVGAGLVVASIPLNNAYQNNLRKAIANFNQKK